MSLQNCEEEPFTPDLESEENPSTSNTESKTNSFTPNPNSKTPLTDEMLFNVREIKKEEEGGLGRRHAEDFVESFTIPTEKEDLLAMYLACKTNGWDKKAKAITLQMKFLFKNDPDIKEFFVAEEKEEAEEIRMVEEEERMLEEEDRIKKEKEKKETIIALVVVVSLFAIGGLVLLLNS